MKHHTFITALVGLSIVALAGCASSQAPVEVFSSTLVAPTTTLSQSGNAYPTNVLVYRYATAEEVDEMGRVLSEKGSEALIRALGKNEMGRLTTNTPGPGLALRMIYQVPTANGRKVVAITERPISFIEIWESTRSRDYEFAYLELNLDPEGNGDGTLVRAGQIQSIGAHTLLVTNYESQPVRLLSVRKR